MKEQSATWTWGTRRGLRRRQQQLDQGPTALVQAGWKEVALNGAPARVCTWKPPWNIKQRTAEWETVCASGHLVKQVELWHGYGPPDAS